MPIKNKKGSYLFKIKKKQACIVTFLDGKDKSELTAKDCYVVGKILENYIKRQKNLKSSGKIQCR